MGWVRFLPASGAWQEQSSLSSRLCLGPPPFRDCSRTPSYTPALRHHNRTPCTYLSLRCPRTALQRLRSAGGHSPGSQRKGHRFHDTAELRSRVLTDLGLSPESPCSTRILLSAHRAAQSTWRRTLRNQAVAPNVRLGKLVGGTRPIDGCRPLCRFGNRHRGNNPDKLEPKGLWMVTLNDFADPTSKNPLWLLAYI